MGTPQAPNHRAPRPLPSAGDSAMSERLLRGPMCPADSPPSSGRFENCKCTNLRQNHGELQFIRGYLGAFARAWSRRCRQAAKAMSAGLVWSRSVE